MNVANTIGLCNIMQPSNIIYVADHPAPIFLSYHLTRKMSAHIYCLLDDITRSKVAGGFNTFLCFSTESQGICKFSQNPLPLKERKPWWMKGIYTYWGCHGLPIG